MKNKLNQIAVRCAIVFAVIVSLGITVFALSDEHMADNESPEVNNTVVFMQKEAVLTDSISEIKNSTNFENYGYKIEELSASELNSVKSTAISRDKALEIAIGEVENMAKSEARSINTVSGRFTDPETAFVPNTEKSLKDTPVWLVTFNDVTIERNGPAGDYDRSIVADVNVVIDIATGEVLEIISHAA